MGIRQTFPIEVTGARRSRLPLFAVVGGMTALGLAMAGAPLLAVPDPVVIPPQVEAAPAYQGRLMDLPADVAPTGPDTPSAIVRVRGRLDQGMADALGAAGVAPAVAASFLRTVAQRARGLDIGADDHFDLVADMTAAGGPQLVYAALDRVGASDVQLVRVDGQWVDADGSAGDGRQRRPVGGRVTSGFGVRHHPILGFSRMHQGIDFAATYGQPVVAAASGTVVGASWAGGYGRQVKIAHGGGLTSSYSHLSGFAVSASGHVSAGQVIGYAGSSGLSTGPHVHFEIRRNGVAVDPTGTRLAGGTMLSPAVAAKVKARMDALLQIAPQPRG